MLSLTTRINSRTTSLTNPILLNLRGQISTDSTPISVQTSVPFTAHNCDVPSRTVSSKLLDFFRTMSPMRRAEIAADSLYNWNLVRGYEHDPVERVRKLLSFHDAGTEKELKDIEKEMRKEMDQVTSKAKVAGQRFMCIKTDNLHMASPLPVFMNSHQPMLKATYAHFSSTAESQKVPLSGNKHLRPLSPHLSVYKPQSSSMFSIFNRMSAAMLTVIVLSFTLLTMKMGYICLSYAYFYQLLFYLSKLIPISMDISALALAYHLFHSGYLVLKRMK